MVRRHLLLNIPHQVARLVPGSTPRHPRLLPGPRLFLHQHPQLRHLNVSWPQSIYVTQVEQHPQPSDPLMSSPPHSSPPVMACSGQLQGALLLELTPLLPTITHPWGCPTLRWQLICRMVRSVSKPAIFFFLSILRLKKVESTCCHLRTWESTSW